MEQNEKTNLEEKKKSEVEPIQEKTFLEQGLNLPIFTGSTDRSFTFKEWDMDMEEKIAELYRKGKSNGIFVREMMDELLETFQGKEWSEYGKEEKLLLFNNICFTNMLYLYKALRIDEVDHELTFDKVACPHIGCNHVHENFVVDLRTLDVIVKNTEESLKKHYELKKPFMLGEQLITGINYTVATWGAMESLGMDGMGNMAKVKKAFFNSAIQGATSEGKNIEGFVDKKSLIKKIRKTDQTKLSDEIAENNGGAGMAIGGKCENCKREFVQLVDWKYDVFFDSSSQ